MKNIREHLTRNSMFSFGHCPNYLSKPSQLKIDQKSHLKQDSSPLPWQSPPSNLSLYRILGLLDQKFILAIIIILLIFVTTLIVVIITYHGHHHDLLVLKEKMLNLFSCLLPRSPVLAALKILFIAKT